MDANTRRQMILERLSVRRQDNVKNLASEFGVSVRTIKYDIERLVCSVPISTSQGNGGCISVAEGWYYSHTYLTDKQEALLRKLSEKGDMQSEEALILQSILETFAMPKVTV